MEFETRIRSHGLPDCWSQAAVYYALAEGLAGIEDAGKAFDRVRIAPRWAAGESSKADVTLHYPASDGYCAYSYRLEKARRRIVLDVTGSFTTAQVHCLLPKGARLRRVSVDGKELPFKRVRVEKSAYADFALEALPAGPVTVEFRPAAHNPPWRAKRPRHEGRGFLAGCLGRPGRPVPRDPRFPGHAIASHVLSCHRFRPPGSPRSTQPPGPARQALSAVEGRPPGRWSSPAALG